MPYKIFSRKGFLDDTRIDCFYKKQMALVEEHIFQSLHQQYKGIKDELAKGLRIGDKTNEFTARLVY